MLNLDVARDINPFAVLVKLAEDHGIAVIEPEAGIVSAHLVESGDAQHCARVESEHRFARYADVARAVPARNRTELKIVWGKRLSARRNLRHNRTNACISGAFASGGCHPDKEIARHGGILIECKQPL